MGQKNVHLVSILDPDTPLNSRELIMEPVSPVDETNPQTARTHKIATRKSHAFYPTDLHTFQAAQNFEPIAFAEANGKGDSAPRRVHDLVAKPGPLFSSPPRQSD